jgi:hypothetical protein
MVQSAAVGDLDGDGRLEVVATTREGNLFVWRSTGDECGAIPWRRWHHDEWGTGNADTDARPPASLRAQEISARAMNSNRIRLTMARVPGDGLYCGTAAFDVRVAEQPIVDEAGFAAADPVTVSRATRARACRARSPSAATTSPGARSISAWWRATRPATARRWSAPARSSCRRASRPRRRRRARRSPRRAAARRPDRDVHALLHAGRDRHGGADYDCDSPGNGDAVGDGNRVTPSATIPPTQTVAPPTLTADAGNHHHGDERPHPDTHRSAHGNLHTQATERQRLRRRGARTTAAERGAWQSARCCCWCAAGRGCCRTQEDKPRIPRISRI